jgi:hypothetical protein
MIGSEYAESVEWCNRVLAAPNIATDLQLVEATVTKGTALRSSGFWLEGEVLMRGAIELADRMGFVFPALRARNNILSSVRSLGEAQGIIDEGYEMAARFGQGTWSYQFAHVSLSNAFERGEWDYGIERAEGLDAPGFYASWLLMEKALRAAFRGDIEYGRALHAKAKEDAGSDSSQAIMAQATVEAAIDLAAGEMAAVLPLARPSLASHESADAAAVTIAAAAVAMNEPSWVRETRDVILAFDRRGPLAEGQIHGLETALALCEGRWSDARRSYLLAKRNLEAGHAFFWLALVNLEVGTRGSGHITEAADALVAAEEFFRGVGAGSFLDRYREAFVPDAIPAARATVVPATSEVSKT